MIIDYLKYNPAFPGLDGGRAVCDLWGTVQAASDRTRKGNVRVKAAVMKDQMDVFDNVPVLTCCGGADHGAFFLPEEGDIVRLSFPGGDFRHPVVTGCRFPEDSPFVKDMYRDGKIKKAFQAKNGSGVFFCGEKGRESIMVSGSRSMEWKLDEEKQEIVCGDREQENRMLLDKKNGKVQIVSRSTLQLQCGKSSIELKEDGTIVLKCEQLTLEAKDVRIQGKRRAQIRGQEVSLEGSTGISVQSGSQIKVNSKGTLKLSGAMIHLN